MKWGGDEKVKRGKEKGNETEEGEDATAYTRCWGYHVSGF